MFPDEDEDDEEEEEDEEDGGGGKAKKKGPKKGKQAAPKAKGEWVCAAIALCRSHPQVW